MKSVIERKTCTAPDGLEIVYSAAGFGEPALVFIHGRLANRGFWDREIERLCIALSRYCSGSARTWRLWNQATKVGIPKFRADVFAVLEAEHAKKVILFGNSLGGPVAIEAALLLPGRVLGVVGIDTSQSLTLQHQPEEAQIRADAFRDDYTGSLPQIVRQLFHKDADPAMLADAEQRMAHTSLEATHSIFLSLAGYVPSEAARRLTVPLRAIPVSQLRLPARPSRR